MNNSLYSTICVVIPTFNRKNILGKCLEAYFQQIYPLDKIEITIVDDGSSDGTELLIQEIKKESPIEIIYYKQKNLGVAKARNRGIKNSKNKIILLSDDDILPTPNLIFEHMKWHNLHPAEEEAILGYITWPPEVEIDDFRFWCENGGLTNYPLIENKSQVDSYFFASGNISLKNIFLKENLFDEDFYFGYEDYELGHRLSKKGSKIFYNKAALGYHLKEKFNFSVMEKRAEITGQGARLLHLKWPELKKTVKTRNLWLLKVTKLISTLLYPLAKIFRWKRIIYHYKYGNRISHIFSKSYKQLKPKTFQISNLLEKQI